MWWPFRGRRARQSSPTADHVPPEPTRAWRRLPVLRTIATGLPPTAVVLLRMPDVAGTRSALPDLRLRKRRTTPAPKGAPAQDVSTVDYFALGTPVVVGRATGLLVVCPEPLAPVPPPEPLAALVDEDGVAEPVVPIAPPVRRPAVPRRPAAPVLTAASVEFVSEPVEPDSPFRSMTEFDRLAAQYEAMGIETAMSALGLGDASGLAALIAAPPPPEPESVRSAVDVPRAPRARPTLGQSRRRGVGLPAVREDPNAPPTPDASAERFVPDEAPTAATPVDDVPAAATPVDVERFAASKVLPPATPVAANDVLPSATPVDVDPTAAPPTSRTRLPAEPAPPVVNGDGRPDDRRTSRTVVQPPLFTSPPKTRRATTPPRPSSAPDSTPVRTPPPASGAPPRQAVREPLAHRPAVEPPTVRWDGPVHRAAIGHGPPPSAFRSDVDGLPEQGADIAHVPVRGEQVVPRQAVHFAEPESVEVRVPSDVVTAFQRDLGVDVADVPVHSGRAVTRRAAGLGARAFTQGGRVHLPHAVATLDRGDTRALLAHELVHVVQQRVLGADLPGEDSAQGQELEAVARSAERWFLGEERAPVSLVHRTRPAPATAQAPTNATESLQRAPHPTATSPVHEDAGTIPSNSPMSWTPETGFTESPRPDAPAPPTSPTHHRGVEPDAAGLAEAFTQIADLRSTLSALRRERGASRDDRTSEPDHLDTGALADRLYRRIRSRLRSELLIDRERTGSLADPGPGGHR